MKIRQTPELHAVEKTIGQFIEYWGFKEIEGRIWTHLLLSSIPLCPRDLMDLTGVSKGLISISLARLLEYKVIEVESVRAKGTQYYQVNEDVTGVIKDVLRKRERKLLSQVNSAINLLESLPADNLHHINLKRVKYLKKMTHTGKNILDSLLFKENKIVSFFFGYVPKLTSKNASKGVPNDQ